MAQSFVERNKLWLLPLLGLMAVGVIVMNVKMLGRKPAVIPDPPPGAPAAATVPAAPAAPPAPTPAVPPPAAPARAASPGGNADLWADLRALESPAPNLNQKEALLARGADPLKEEALLGGTLRPAAVGRARRLEEAPVPPSATPAVASLAQARPLPEVDFLIRNGRGSQAWLEGAGFREGQVVSPGWRVKRITGGMVEVEGPGGVVRRFTNPLAPDTPRFPEPASPHVPRKEAP